GLFFFFSSRRRHTRCYRDWSSDVCSSDLYAVWLLARRLRDAEDPLALIAEVRPRLGATLIIMLASTRSEEAYVREPQRVGVVDRSEERRVGKECRARR